MIEPWLGLNFEFVSARITPMKYTQHFLDKLEDILGESEYVVRYERGTFQSGWCLLEARKIVVLNKFLDTEGRINTLMEIIPQLNIEFDKLTHESQKLYDEVVKKSELVA
jgi:hypothetical protein